MIQGPETPDTGKDNTADDEFDEVLSIFTEQLRKLFADTLNEPVPDRFLELLDKLDSQWEDREE